MGNKNITVKLKQGSPICADYGCQRPIKNLLLYVGEVSFFKGLCNETITATVKRDSKGKVFMENRHVHVVAEFDANDSIFRATAIITKEPGKK